MRHEPFHTALSMRNAARHPEATLTLDSIHLLSLGRDFGRGRLHLV